MVGSRSRTSPLATGCITGLQKEMAETGKSRVQVEFSHCPRRTGICLMACRAMPCHAILFHLLTPSPWKNASALMQPLSCREIRRSCKALLPSILRSHTGICPSAADTPTLLCTTIGRSQYYLSIVGKAVKKLSRKERRSSYDEGGCMTSDIALSACPKALGRLVDWHILQAFPVARHLSCQSCTWRGPIGGSLADPPRKCSWQSPRDDPAASNQPRATQLRRIRHVLRQRGNSPGSSHPPAAPGAQLGRRQAASLWDISATGCCAATRGGRVHGVSVSGARCSEGRWWCDDEADCERVWTLSSS
jgi:hypothetical protein